MGGIRDSTGGWVCTFGDAETYYPTEGTPPSVEHGTLMAASPDLLAALQPIAAAYPDDPGTSDLDDDQPVRITLGDVRRAWAAISRSKVKP